MVKPGFSAVWKSYIFDDLFDFIPNNAFTRAQMADSGKVKNIHYGDILTKYGAYINANSKDIPYIAKEIDLSRFSERCYLQSGDVIIADTAEDETVGKAIEVINVESPVLAGQHTLLCRPKVRFAERFLGYYLNASCYHDQLLPYIVGTKVSSVSKASVAQTKLVAPEYEEQRRIADALTAIDELIANQERLIAKKKAVKQGAMQELLTGKKRLPGFSGEWDIKHIDDVAVIMDEHRIPVRESDRDKMEGFIPYCGANGVVGYVNDYTINDDIILIAEDGGYFDEYATRPIAYKMSGKCWVNNHAHIIKAKANANQDFLFYSLVHKDIRDFITSGTRAKLNKSELLKIAISLPLDINEQTAIASILSDMDDEIIELEQKYAKYHKIKQGMMQQLLTGKIRLV